MSKIRLDSWKSIAVYLERSSRTVQRWHAYHALPVHHVGGSKGSVFAYAEEIDRWLAGLGAEAKSAEVGADEGFAARKSRSFELTARAHEMWETRSEESLQTIAGLYRKAIHQDPGNAGAFTGLAKAMISSALQGVMDSSVAFLCATEAMQRAAQLDAEDVDGKCSAAWLQMAYERRWRQARTGFEKALSQQPQHSFALAGMALLHIAEDDPGAASIWAWEAWRQNTLACPLGALVCWSLYLAGEIEAALEMAGQVRASGGCGATLGTIEALALIQAGPIGSMIQRIEAIAGEFPQSYTLQGALGYAYALGEQRGKAWDILRNLEQMSAQKKRSNAYGLALILMGLGSRQEATQWLETAFAEGSLWSLGFRTDPILRPLSGETHYEMLCRRIGTHGGDGAHASDFECMAKAV